MAKIPMIVIIAMLSGQTPEQITKWKKEDWLAFADYLEQSQKEAVPNRPINVGNQRPMSQEIIDNIKSLPESESPDNPFPGVPRPDPKTYTKTKK